MRVKCDLCGKKYELKYNGAPCPKCGQKNYSMEMAGQVDVKSVATPENTVANKQHSDLHKQYDGGGHHVEAPKAFSPHYTVNEDNTSYAKKKPKISSSIHGSFVGKIFTVVEVIIIIILVIIPAVYQKPIPEENDTGIEESIDENYVEYISPSDNGTYTHKAETYDITYTPIEEYAGEDALVFELPEGYEMISYVYSVDAPQGDYGYYGLWDVIQTYIVTSEGNYVVPINATLAEELLVSAENDLDNFICSDISEKSGIICFLVEEGTVEYMMVDIFAGDYGKRSIEKRYIFSE